MFPQRGVGRQVILVIVPAFDFLWNLIQTLYFYAGRTFASSLSVTNELNGGKARLNLQASNWLCLHFLTCFKP